MQADALEERHNSNIAQLQNSKGGNSERLVDLLEKKCAQLTFKIKQQQEAMTNMQVGMIAAAGQRNRVVLQCDSSEETIYVAG